MSRLKRRPFTGWLAARNAGITCATMGLKWFRRLRRSCIGHLRVLRNAVSPLRRNRIQLRSTITGTGAPAQRTLALRAQISVFQAMADQDAVQVLRSSALQRRFETFLHNKSPAAELLWFEGWYALANAAAMADADGLILPRLSHDIQAAAGRHPLGGWRPRRGASVEGPVIAVTGQFPDNYFHWLIEIVPRILIAMEHVPNARAATWVLPRSRLRSAREILSMLGISRIRYVGGDEAVECRTGVAIQHTPVPPNWSFKTPPEILELFERFIPEPPPASTDASKLFFSRQTARYRRVENWEEVLPMLENHGFDVIEPGELSFMDQMRVSRAARIVGGVHGAGLANLVFCAPEAQVVEFIPDKYENFNFASISASRGLRHRLVACETGLPSFVSPRGNLGRLNLRIDPGQLDATLFGLSSVA